MGNYVCTSRDDFHEHHSTTKKRPCVKAIIFDENDPELVYTGSFDYFVRQYHLGSAELQRVYFGCERDVIDLAQCTTRGGVDLLFAVPAGLPGVCCWRRSDAQLLRIFTTGPGKPFSGYGVEATATTLYCGHALEGVLSWAIPPNPTVRAGPDPEVPHVSAHTSFRAKGPVPSARGPAKLLSSNGAIALALGPKPAGAGAVQKIATAHIVDTRSLLSLADGGGDGGTAAERQAAVAAANERQLDGEFGAMVWDAASGVALGALLGSHTAALRALAWHGDAVLFTGDLEARVVQWDVPSAAPLRTLGGAGEQARCRALVIVPAGLWSGAGAPVASGRSAPLLLVGADRGAPIVAHELDAARPAEPPAKPRVVGTAAAPAAAANSLFSLGVGAKALLSGHSGGQLYQWRGERFERELGATTTASGLDGLEIVPSAPMGRSGSGGALSAAHGGSSHGGSRHGRQGARPPPKAPSEHGNPLV